MTKKRYTSSMESDETIQLGAKTLKRGRSRGQKNCVRSLRRQEAESKNESRVILNFEAPALGERFFSV
ncbi:hypothetical protein TNCV_435111 [Trichonephila clavipes]|nr:hypothetical protein TNCV_435111 [Trichonephila clavipes]